MRLSLTAVGRRLMVVGHAASVRGRSARGKRRFGQELEPRLRAAPVHDSLMARGLPFSTVPDLEDLQRAWAAVFFFVFSTWLRGILVSSRSKMEMPIQTDAAPAPPSCGRSQHN